MYTEKQLREAFRAGKDRGQDLELSQSGLYQMSSLDEDEYIDSLKGRLTRGYSAKDYPHGI